jgi:hypothetical protein
MTQLSNLNLSYVDREYDPTAFTYSGATMLYYQLLALSPGCRMTLAEVHIASANLSTLPVNDDPSWLRYVSASAPMLKEI